jgi:outer membrane protein OmpA-like peptidoglycan-associated protein
MVDYLDATVIARGRVRVPTGNIKFLTRLDPPGKPTWWKRLWKDAATLEPTVRVTIELVQVGTSLTPFTHYQDGFVVKEGLEEYLVRLHTKAGPSDIDFAPAIGGGFLISSTKDLEKELGIPGQLDKLFRAGKIGVPLAAKDQQRLFWMVYATFPDRIRKYVIPQTRIILDEFVFNKSDLTGAHGEKLRAIARHILAVTKFAGDVPKIALTGHTDDRGTEAYNIKLGEQRIASVDGGLQAALDDIIKGISKRFTITSKSFGESKPIVKARTEAEHARNRRVEVLISTLKPRVKRVSLRAVVGRSLKLLDRLPDTKQAKRIECFLRKVVKKGTDDRYVWPELVLNVYNKMTPFGTYGFNVLRDQLTIEGVFGSSNSDASLLNSLQSIDERIIKGISEVNKYIAILAGAGSAGVPLVAMMKSMDALRAFMHGRVKDPNSIYHCYKDV